MPRQTGTFNKPELVYGRGGIPLPPEKTLKRGKTAPEGLHDNKPFFPTKRRGLKKTFEPFPQYMVNPPKELKRKIKDPNVEEKESFKIPKKR